MATFLREIAMEPDDEQRLAVRPAHREYVSELFSRGAIRMSGPLVGDAGAIIVYEAPDEEAARALMNADPYCRADIVREVSLRAWNVVVPASYPPRFSGSSPTGIATVWRRYRTGMATVWGGGAGLKDQVILVDTCIHVRGRPCSG